MPQNALAVSTDSGDIGGLQLEQVGALSLRDWVALTERDGDPFGHAAEKLEWRAKERHVCLRDPDGALVAAGGAAIVTVVVADTSFEVVGLGGLIVRRELRGHGVMTRVADAIARVAERMGPEHAMLFSQDHLLGVYRGRGYRAIEAPVSVDQPAGRIVMTQTAMWRPLRAGATWPEGPVEVYGLPF